MPHSRKPSQEAAGAAPFDYLTDRFRDSLNCKPDFRQLDLGSPVSPLTHNASITTTNNGAATTTTSSSSSSGSVSAKQINATQSVDKPESLRRKSNSGELFGLSETTPNNSRSAAKTQNLKPGHRRSVSAGIPLIYSGSSFAATSLNCNNSSATSGSSNQSPNLLPSGNICPSGKIFKTGMVSRASSRTDTLGKGTANYGHGSIVRSSGKMESNVQKALGSNSDPEEVKNAGNEMYRRGNFLEALTLYDRAISMSPENPAYRSNRAAALTALGRLGQAVRECEEAVKLDNSYARAHQRLASLYLRLGHADIARYHLCFPGQNSDPGELQKLQLLEKHLDRCTDARRIGDWKSVVKEIDAAITIGADSSPQLIACKAEALLKLHCIEDAESCISEIPKLDSYPSSQTKIFGMAVAAYVLYVRAQVEIALGRFEDAVSKTEKAALIDYSNAEVATFLNKVKLVARARSCGNDHFCSGRYSEACSAYGEGLKYNVSNSVLYCNRAACWFKLGLWEKSVEDCNQALRFHQNYIKALLRRAISNGKLGRWAETVKDYEVLRKQLPGDDEVAESLRHAQSALRKSLEEKAHIQVCREVEELPNMDKFKAAISLPGVSVVHFKVASNIQSEELSPFVNMLCIRYPSVNFFKVDVEENFSVVRAEGIRTVPTFKIYKNGEKVKEMIRPSHQVLEESVRKCIV